jgi:hypothetical protein
MDVESQKISAEITYFLCNPRRFFIQLQVILSICPDIEEPDMTEHKYKISSILLFFIYRQTMNLIAAKLMPWTLWNQETMIRS